MSRYNTGTGSNGGKAFVRTRMAEQYVPGTDMQVQMDLRYPDSCSVLLGKKPKEGERGWRFFFIPISILEKVNGGKFHMCTSFVCEWIDSERIRVKFSDGTEFFLDQRMVKAAIAIAAAQETTRDLYDESLLIEPKVDEAPPESQVAETTA